MTVAEKTKNAAVGDLVEVPKGESILVLPDGCAVTVRGSFRLDVEGLHQCGSLRVNAKKKD